MNSTLCTTAAPVSFLSIVSLPPPSFHQAVSDPNPPTSYANSLHNMHPKDIAPLLNHLGQHLLNSRTSIMVIPTRPVHPAELPL